MKTFFSRSKNVVTWKQVSFFGTKDHKKVKEKKANILSQIPFFKLKIHQYLPSFFCPFCFGEGECCHSSVYWLLL
jgi:hypothetical protein